MRQEKHETHISFQKAHRRWN